MTSEDNALDNLDNLDNLNHMNGLISSSPGRQASSTPPMPPSTQKRPCSPLSANSAPGYAHNSGYATTVSSPSMSSQDRSLAEIIGIPFPEFDHKNEVIDPFSEDENRDQAFKEELTEMLLDALIETHAWSTARLKHESLAAAEKFEAGISNIMEIQQDQGTLTSSLSLSSSPSVSPSVASNSSSISVFEQTRQRLNEFIGRIRNAIAALTNTMLIG